MKQLFAVLVSAALFSSMSVSAYEITPMLEEEFLAHQAQCTCSCHEQTVLSRTNILPANENIKGVTGFSCIEKILG